MEDHPPVVNADTIEGLRDDFTELGDVFGSMDEICARYTTKLDKELKIEEQKNIQLMEEYDLYKKAVNTGIKLGLIKEADLISPAIQLTEVRDLILSAREHLWNLEEILGMIRQLRSFLADRIGVLNQAMGLISDSPEVEIPIEVQHYFADLPGERNRITNYGKEFARILYRLPKDLQGLKEIEGLLKRLKKVGSLGIL